MKVAIVHDYIKEYGGAERVLEALCEIYPKAPIYTSFVDKNSSAYERFKDKKIISTWFNNVPYASKLVSPLRFLTPWIWGSLDLSEYDVVISSAAWFITKGFKKEGDRFIEICYCHTPPRWLYGYTTSLDYKKHALVRLYAAVVGHFMRIYDFERASKVDYFIANSEEVKKRIEKFYRRDSVVIYPPVSLPEGKSSKDRDYYFIVSRLAGSKGLEMAVDGAVKAGFSLKIAGESAGYYSSEALKEKAKGKVEFLGRVTDEELVSLYKGAKGFLALARDEDFGITPVESMMAGTPVIAVNAGGYKETVVDGKTGILFDNYSVDGLITAIKRFEKTKFDPKDLKQHAQKFNKERFKKEIKLFIEKHA